jgi:predicted nucleic-acid-binding protein
MRAVDTNILVRLIARDDLRQVEAAERFVAGGAWVSLLVLQESLWVLERAYELDKKAIAKVVELLLEHQSLALEAPRLVADALALYLDAGRVGFSDCLILATARLNGHTPLGTFDKRLAKLQGAQLAS